MKPLTTLIPASGEALPAIGLGTSTTFNVVRDPGLRAERTEVLATFLELRGGMVDSSTMYRSADGVVGHAIELIGDSSTLFSATRAWTRGAGHGANQMADSRDPWGLERLDRMPGV